MARGARAARPSWLAILAALAAAVAGADIEPRPLRGTRAEAATLIVQGIEGGSLPFAALAPSAAAELVTGADGSPRVRLPIAFEVPARATSATTLEFYVYAISETGAVAAHLATALDLEPGALAESTGAKLIATLDLPPATYSIRFLVLEPASHRFGLRLLQVALPASGQPAILTRPTIEDACTGWTVAATPQAPEMTAAAVPVLLRGSRIELSSSLLGRAPDAPAGSRLATVHLEPSQAGAAESHTFEAELAGGAQRTEGRESFAITFELPQIARGAYRLSVGLEHGAGRLMSPPTAAWVVDSGDLDTTSTDPCARTWSAVIARSSEEIGAVGALPATGSGASGDAGSEKRVERLKLRRAYLGVLRQLAASGDLATASEALGEVEHQLANVRSGLQALLRNELDVARRLSARQPEILPPLMMLHHEAYLVHFRHQRFPLAGHSSRAVQALAELMVDRRQHQENRALASGILTSLAEYGHRNRMFVPSQFLLQDALEMDPANQEALLLLAVSYEWFGRYEEAGRLLERLVRTAAAHSEARLRLGIMRLRSGDAIQAERDFRLILREGAPPWLLSLTYQALARLLQGQERYEEAVELLRRGRSRLRSDQRLHVLSAHALDRAGRPAEAQRLLAALPIGDSLRTPRFRYGESLTSPLTSLRDGISRSVAVRLPLLKQALESEPAR